MGRIKRASCCAREVMEVMLKQKPHDFMTESVAFDVSVSWYDDQSLIASHGRQNICGLLQQLNDAWIWQVVFISWKDVHVNHTERKVAPLNY
jgi:hypothetical protein